MCEEKTMSRFYYLVIASIMLLNSSGAAAIGGWPYVWSIGIDGDTTFGSGKTNKISAFFYQTPTTELLLANPGLQDDFDALVEMSALINPESPYGQVICINDGGETPDGRSPEPLLEAFPDPAQGSDSITKGKDSTTSYDAHSTWLVSQDNIDTANAACSPGHTAFKAAAHFVLVTAIQTTSKGDLVDDISLYCVMDGEKIPLTQDENGNNIFAQTDYTLCAEDIPTLWGDVYDYHSSQN